MRFDSFVLSICYFRCVFNAYIFCTESTKEFIRSMTLIARTDLQMLNSVWGDHFVTVISMKMLR